MVGDETQIHTHMCYSDFGDIMEQIQQMDADVLLIEAARSRMELLHDWERTGYAQEIGPGVYDIHSPRVPSTEEMVELLQAAADGPRAEQIWVNPDCGLKTRAWPETEAALRNMVDAAKQLREQLVAADVALLPASEPEPRPQATGVEEAVDVADDRALAVHVREPQRVGGLALLIRGETIDSVRRTCGSRRRRGGSRSRSLPAAHRERQPGSW